MKNPLIVFFLVLMFFGCIQIRDFPIDSSGRLRFLEPLPDEIFSSLINNSFQKNWIINYSTIQSTSFTNLLYYKKDKQSRFDIVFDDTEARIYFLADGSYACGKDFDGWICYKSSIVLLSGFNIFQSEYLNGSEVKLLQDRTILGRETKCFELKYNTYCLSNDGVPLFFSDSFSTLETISYLEEVGESDLILPGQVQIKELSINDFDELKNLSSSRDTYGSEAAFECSIFCSDVSIDERSACINSCRSDPFLFE